MTLTATISDSLYYRPTQSRRGLSIQINMKCDAWKLEHLKQQVMLVLSACFIHLVLGTFEHILQDRAAFSPEDKRSHGFTATRQVEPLARAATLTFNGFARNFDSWFCQASCKNYFHKLDFQTGNARMDPAEVEFLAEKESVAIVPNFSQDKLYLIGVLYTHCTQTHRHSHSHSTLWLYSLHFTVPSTLRSFCHICSFEFCHCHAWPGWLGQGTKPKSLFPTVSLSMSLIE